MKKILLTLALIALTLTGSAQTISTANFANPLPVSDMAFSRAGAITTLTASTTIQAMPIMAAGTKVVAVTTYNGAIAYGNASLTNTIPCYWPQLASGTTTLWNYDTIKPSTNGIYFLNAASGGVGAVSFTPLR